MQTDMHYYGTYAMARAAGISPPAARIIATASEFVDDSDHVEILLSDGSFIEAPATAHHPVNVSNLNEVDQRKVWVPFHFIPGNEGNSYEERLVCRKDGALAREMAAHHLAQEDRGFILELMGITAHVYADTFSHYGFSGISSSLNKVHSDSIKLHVIERSVLDYIMNKAAAFNERYIEGAAADAVALGHGAVATYPDRPYLSWRFKYQDADNSISVRANQETFLDACRKLHEMFVNFSNANPDFSDPLSHCHFPDVQDVVAQVLAVEGNMDARIEAWQKAAASGRIYPNPGNEAIPAYANTFDQNIKILQSHSFQTVGGTGGYAFLAAAKFHRDYVLDELLPKYGLHVLMRT